MYCLPGQTLHSQSDARLDETSEGSNDRAQTRPTRRNRGVQTAQSGAELDIQAENDPHFRVIVLNGRLDLLTVPVFTEFMKREILRGSRQLLIDCSGLEYVSSAGIGELVAAGKALAAREGSLTFAAPTRGVAKVFETVGFRRMYSIYESRKTAGADARWMSGWR